MSIALSFRTEESTREELDRIAGVLDRNRNWVINQAIESYIDTYRWQLEHIGQGIKDSSAGRTFSTEQVRARLAEHMSKATAGK
jgi:predicted transcriptional regulator